MSELFILQNQEKLFLGKQNNWVDGRDLGAVYKSPHKDEAINQMFEASSKDYKQRIKIVSCTASEKGLPVIDPDIMPEPLPKPAKELFVANDRMDEAPANDNTAEQVTTESENSPG